MLAAENGHTDIVNALAGTHGANVDAVNRDGRTALMLAANPIGIPRISPVERERRLLGIFDPSSSSD